MLPVYPPWIQPMRGTRLNLLALAYPGSSTRPSEATRREIRAARYPMHQAVALGMAGLVLGALGTVAALAADLEAM